MLGRYGVPRELGAVLMRGALLRVIIPRVHVDRTAPAGIVHGRPELEFLPRTLSLRYLHGRHARHPRSTQPQLCSSVRRRRMLCMHMHMYMYHGMI